MNTILERERLVTVHKKRMGEERESIADYFCDLTTC